MSSSTTRSTDTTTRPARTECAEYYLRYTSLVPDGDIIHTIESQFPRTLALLRTVPAQRETWAYAPDKWNFRESVGHLIDMERVFTGRAIWIARDPATALPSFEQDVWAANSNAAQRPLSDLLDEWTAVRAATVALFRSLDAESWVRSGTASGNPFTVRTFAWIAAGHELHHNRIFVERYGVRERA